MCGCPASRQGRHVLLTALRCNVILGASYTHSPPVIAERVGKMERAPGRVAQREGGVVTSAWEVLGHVLVSTLCLVWLVWLVRVFRLALMGLMRSDPPRCGTNALTGADLQLLHRMHIRPF